MATHSSDISTPRDDRTDFQGGGKLRALGIGLAIVSLGAAFGLSRSSGDPYPIRPFLFAYLSAYVFALTVALGCLAFVLLQHATRAGWSVSVRRVAENYAATLPILAVLSIPIIVSVASGNGFLFRWALPMERAENGAVEAADKSEAELEPTKPDDKKAREDVHIAAPTDPATFKLDPLDLAKRNYGLHWLNPGFFIFRIIFYVGIWSIIAWWFRKTSIEQDQSGDENLTSRMQALAPPSLVILGLTITGAAFDLIMSLDPHWYSTMFGVYYIASSLQIGFATMIITVYLLQKAGYLRQSVTIEHYHDLGKYLFAFTFFYGYIAFSQYMLMWYANIPEETGWMARHGVSTAHANGWSPIIIAILLGHILIPFAGLLSRYPKRRPTFLVFWALWQIAFVAIDMWWLVNPEFGPSNASSEGGPEMMRVLVWIAAVVGFIGVLIAGFATAAAKANLRPTHDPRLADALVFQNM